MKTSSWLRWTIAFLVGAAFLTWAAEAMADIPLEKLPKHVRRNLLSRIDPGQLRFVEKVSEDNQIIYRAYFDGDGEQRVMLLSRNGLILKTVAISPGAGTLEDMLRPSADAQKVEYASLPPEVQDEVADRAEHIQEIRKSVVAGRVVYDFKLDEESLVRELRVARDGPVLQKTFAGVMPIDGLNSTIVEAAGAEKSQKK